MNISAAILAFLTSGPLSGYDLKKRFAESESLHWSGNNNQVYTALTQLHRDGLVVREVQQPREGPARKVYSLTEAGRQALRAWLLAPPQLPEFRAPILVQLMGGELLSDEELDRLLAAYEEELRMKLLMLDEQERRGSAPAPGSRRQQQLWQLINRHAAVLHRAERDWVLDAQWSLLRLRKESE